MFAVNVLKSLSKSFFPKIRASVFSLKHVQRNSYKTKPITSFDVKSHVGSDVTLFHYESPKYFMLINFFSTTQCVFWTCLGIFFIKDLKKSSITFDSQHFWGKILQMEHKYSDVFGVIAVIFGWSILVGTFFFSLRSIRKIVLHKGGKFVTIITYNLPGFNTIKIPLNNMSSFEHRTKAKKYIPVKIKDKYFYYLLDTRGEFSNPTLFDFTAGVRRTF